MTQGLLFTDDDVQADTDKDFAERMRLAADADEGRVIIRDHESAIHDEERRLGLEPTVGVMPWGYRCFSSFKPKELAALSRRSQRCAELVRQGKQMRAYWETILAAHLTNLRNELCGTGPESEADPDCPLGQACGAFNHCTLDGQPARVIGSAQATFATIEPVDLDADPIRCCWDVVDMVMQDGGAFTREDYDIDE